MGCGSSTAAKNVAEPTSTLKVKEQSNPAVSEKSKDQVTAKEQQPAVASTTTPTAPITSNVVENFQPNAGFALKLVDGTRDQKIFVNVFHHDKVGVDDVLTLPLVRVDDKKGEQCSAYHTAISTVRFNDGEADAAIKDKLAKKVLKQLKDTEGFDSAGYQIKMPNIKRGFVGEDIPSFSITKVVVIAPSAATATTAAVPATESAPTPVVASVQPQPTAEPTAPETKSATDSVKQTAAEEPAVEGTTVEVVASVQPSATIPVDMEDEEEAGMEQPVDDELPSTFDCPPKLQGWVRKQGHVVKNWKMRYFILNKGYLAYYADKSDLPPYGTYMKGILCLAGFREKSMYEDSQFSGAQPSVGNLDDTASVFGTSSRRRSSGFFTTDPQYRIHLIYTPGNVGVQHLKRLYPNSDGVPTVKEFVMEATTLEEKYAWLAAISEHTAYLEQALGNGIYPEATDFTEQSIVLPTKKLTNTAPTAQSGDTTTTTTTTTPPTTNTNTDTNTNTNNPNGVSSASTAAPAASSSSEQFHPYVLADLDPNETIVFSGLVGKPNPFGIHLMRQLLVIVNKEVTDAKPHSKRLLYVDSNTFEKKGELVWSPKSPNIQVKKINASCFDVVQGKAYRFFPKDKTTVDRWIDAINNAKV